MGLVESWRPAIYCRIEIDFGQSVSCMLVVVLCRVACNGRWMNESGGLALAEARYR